MRKQAGRGHDKDRGRPVAIPAAPGQRATGRATGTGRRPLDAAIDRPLDAALDRPLDQPLDAAAGRLVGPTSRRKMTPPPRPSAAARGTSKHLSAMSKNRRHNGQFDSMAGWGFSTSPRTCVQTYFHEQAPGRKHQVPGVSGCPVMLYNGLLGPIVATHHSVHTSVERRGKAMNDFFDVAKDQGGNLVLKVPPYQQAALAEEMREGDQRDLRGVSVYAGLLILQTRLAAVEAICLTASIPSANVKGTRSQPTTIKRMGRVDRCRFGWRLDPHDGKKLLPDREEQATIRRAQFLAAAGESLREVCRRLDQEGRGRRGKPWTGAHSVLGAILDREGRAPLSPATVGN